MLSRHHFYLRLYHIHHTLHRPARILSCRDVSTTSAINKGLHASRHASPTSTGGGRDRSEKYRDQKATRKARIAAGRSVGAYAKYVRKEENEARSGRLGGSARSKEFGGTPDDYVERGAPTRDSGGPRRLEEGRRDRSATSFTREHTHARASEAEGGAAWPPSSERRGPQSSSFARPRDSERGDRNSVRGESERGEGRSRYAGAGNGRPAGRGGSARGSAGGEDSRPYAERRERQPAAFGGLSGRTTGLPWGSEDEQSLKRDDARARKASATAWSESGSERRPYRGDNDRAASMPLREGRPSSLGASSDRAFGSERRDRDGGYSKRDDVQSSFATARETRQGGSGGPRSNPYHSGKHERNDGLAERATVQPLKHIPRRETPPATWDRTRTRSSTSAQGAEQEEIWTDIRRLGELVESIRHAQSLSRTARPAVLIEEANDKVTAINTELERLGAGEERRERVFYLQRRMHGLGAYEAEWDSGGRAARETKVREKRGGYTFELLLKGETKPIPAALSPPRGQSIPPSLEERSNHDAPLDESRITRVVNRMRGHLNNLRAQHDISPTWRLASEDIANLHRLLHKIAAFSATLSQTKWQQSQSRIFHNLLKPDYFIHRQGAGPAEKEVRVTITSREGKPKLKLVFDKDGLHEQERSEEAAEPVPVVGEVALQEKMTPLHAEQLSTEIRRVAALLHDIMLIEHPIPTNFPNYKDIPSTPPSASDNLIAELRSLVENINKQAVTKNQHFIKKTFATFLGGRPAVYAHKGKVPDGERTMVWRRSESLYEVVLRGEVGKGTEAGISAKAEQDDIIEDDDEQENEGRLWDREDVGMGAIQPGPLTDRSSQTATRKPALEDGDRDHDIPLRIPYTTAASEFLYGTNPVIAALRAQRRKLHHLHIIQRTPIAGSTDETIVALARKAGVQTTRHADVRLLDKISDSRPHNGVVLEVSRLPAPPVLSLGKVAPGAAHFPLTLDRQTTEDRAINGAPLSLPFSTGSWTRRPFVLMLDGIIDPGNVGNILRTAHFYGADAVAVATNTCAPLSSAVLAKASSGACEAVPVLALPKPANFVADSRRNGWKVYAAVAPDAASPPLRTAAKGSAKTTTTAALAAASPLAQDPVLLMLGAEGEGLRANLTAKADCFVGIERGASGKEEVDVGVESLNVGVAAGVLMESFLREPKVDLGHVVEVVKEAEVEGPGNGEWNLVLEQEDAAAEEVKEEAGEGKVGGQASIEELEVEKVEK